MSLRRSPLLWLNAIVLLVVAAWLWIAPRRAWDGFLVAAESGDDTRLMAAIDVPLFTDNLRTDLATALRNQAGVATQLTGGPMETRLLNSLLESAASPTGVRETLRSFQQRDGANGNSTPPLVTFRYLSPIAVQVRMHHEGAPPNEAGLFTLRFSGTSWRLVRIQSGWLVEKEHS